MTKYKVGMIGTGIKGTQHARAYALNPLTEIVAVADPDPENLELFCRRFKIVRSYSSYDEMLAREQIDIAAPILPARPNPDAVVAAARAGVRAIYCEKPICASLEEADHMVEETRSRGIPWAAADAMRNLPQFWEARAKIESGEWGSVQSINIYIPTAADTRGEFWGANCQDLCVASLFASDAEVDWVVGWVKEDPFSDEDQAMGGYIRFASGIECFAHIRPTCRRGIEILTSRVLFFSDYHSFHLWKLKGNPESPLWADLEKIEGVFADSGLNDMPYDEEGWQYPGNRQIASTQALVDCLEKGVEPRCSGADMARALEISIALRDSHRQGHAPIKLPLEDRSLKIVPLPFRWRNRKEVFGTKRYNQFLTSVMTSQVPREKDS